MRMMFRADSVMYVALNSLKIYSFLTKKKLKIAICR